ncbi:hypothetical protein FW320_06570 [Azospirillum sp. Vi22]|nr:hypothetical protein [Azospirillum baldaniorum]
MAMSPLLMVLIGLPGGPDRLRASWEAAGRDGARWLGSGRRGAAVTRRRPARCRPGPRRRPRRHRRPEPRPRRRSVRCWRAGSAW